MISEWLEGVCFVAIDTAADALAARLADKKINIGYNLLKGLWAGRNSKIGRKAAEESEHEIKKMLQDTDMVFITCGMGWWTGSGAAPVIAAIAKGMGILTVGIITKPFSFGWAREIMNAEEGVKKIKEVVDTLIVIPHDKIFNVIDKKTTFEQAFTMIDKIIYLDIQAISDLLIKPWNINIEFADIKVIMNNSGVGWIWIGYGTWKEKSINATKEAIENFGLYNDLNKAKNVIFSITGWNDFTPTEITEAASLIENIIDKDVPYMWCMVFDDNMKDEAKVTIIGTWLEK